MKRGYRLNSSASFSRYAQSRTANFFLGQGVLKAGVGKVDDLIRSGGRKLNDVAYNGLEGLAAKGKDAGIRANALGDIGTIGTNIDRNASRIRNGLGIAGGIGAVGLGGAALANRGQAQQPRMY